MFSRRTYAFTLIELSLVIAILGLLAAAVFRYSANVTNTQKYAELNNTLNTIEDALRNYSITFKTLPCPADLDSPDGVAVFGQEIGTAGDGLCNEGYNTAINTSADPDNADGLYDATTLGQVVAGAVPTKTLKLDDKYAFDPWGHKILFVVDQRATASNSFTTYSVTNTTIGAIVVKKDSTDTLANSITYKGIYAIVSFGPNGHGGYNRIPTYSITNDGFNGGSTNTDELKNCHCDSNGQALSDFDRIFVQKSKTPSTTLTNAFDDVVRFKTRSQMASYAELQ